MLAIDALLVYHPTAEGEALPEKHHTLASTTEFEQGTAGMRETMARRKTTGNKSGTANTSKRS